MKEYSKRIIGKGRLTLSHKYKFHSFYGLTKKRKNIDAEVMSGTNLLSCYDDYLEGAKSWSSFNRAANRKFYVKSFAKFFRTPLLCSFTEIALGIGVLL